MLEYFEGLLGFVGFVGVAAWEFGGCVCLWAL